ncbi:MAG: FAD-binding protein, partial [Rhodospirillales bacterium]|nr:FAD-binding protein [Acetobacter sp.]
MQAALHVAREFGVPLTVSGGRCDPFARANRDGHLILDLRRMAAVSYNTAANAVTVQGGTTTGDLLRALPEDLVTVTGKNAMVGVVSLTLGGGYGPLNGRFGLACDALQSAQVVLADGQVVDAS